MATRTDRRPWGSTPPYLSLPEAFSLVAQIYANGGGEATYDVLSRIVGNSTSSSSFTRKLSALKAYGLVDETSKGTITLSPLGSKIAAPLSPVDGALAKREAFLRLKVFAQVHEKHKGKLLPADEFLRNLIEQEFAMPRDVATEWLRAFKDGIRTVGLLHDRGDGKMQIMDSPVVKFRIPLAPPTEEQPQADKVPEPPPETQRTDSGSPQSGHTTRIELAGGRHALFSVPDRLTASDARKLKAVLSGLSSIIESLVAEPEEPTS